MLVIMAKPYEYVADTDDNNEHKNDSYTAAGPGPLILGFWFRPLGPGPLVQALWSWAFTRKMVGDQDSVNVEPKET